VAILAAMQSAAIRLMGQRPTVFFGASQNFEMEIADLVNEVARDIAKSHDWQALTQVHTITGDGEEADFALPDDYDRQPVVTSIQDTTSWVFGYDHIVNLNDFLYLEARDFSPTPGAWTIYGDRLRFIPAPPEDQTATFPYISKYYARDAGTLETKEAFTSDSDTFLLPERLLTLGLVWRWRENKKLDFTGDQEAFTKAIGEYAAKDRGSSVFRRGGRPALRGTYPAWPWQLG
jgi:hypothetical protein